MLRFGAACICGPQVNAMRNRALANAHTDAVLLLDVDFWPSAGAVRCRATILLLPPGDAMAARCSAALPAKQQVGYI